MKHHSMKLVTIICEALAREQILSLLEEVGAHGYTLFQVEGKGARGARAGDIAEFANLQIEVILSEKVAEDLLEQLERDYFPRFAMVVYESEVGVLRGDKF